MSQSRRPPASNPPRPAQPELSINFRLEIGPDLGAILGRLLNLLESPMTAQEFSDFLDAKVNDLKALAATEHDQILAAITAAGSHVGDQVPDDVAAKVAAAFDTLKGTVSGIIADTPVSTPTPTPTPDPAPAPTPAP